MTVLFSLFVLLTAFTPRPPIEKDKEHPSLQDLRGYAIIGIVAVFLFSLSVSLVDCPVGCTDDHALLPSFPENPSYHGLRSI